MPALPGADAPQVDSYDEEIYQCRADDTFAKISSAKYNSDRYAQALLLFNRNHPRAADGIRQDPPTLQAGQQVFVPPLRILEKQYSRAIPNYAPPQAILEAPRRPRPSAPAALSPVPAAGSAALSSSSDRMYKVRGSGEMFLEISRRTLGNGDRWWEIARLNQRFNPKDPVPAGMVLRLPGDAHVEAEDMP